MGREMAKIHIVGAGPGSPEYVTPLARKTVQNANIVIGAERVLSLFAEDIKGEKIALTAKNFHESIAYAVNQAEKGSEVVFLSTGDPGFSGLLRPILKIVGNNSEVNVVPGVSSIQACAARLKLCWDEAGLISLHDGVTAQKKRELAALAKEKTILIILPDPKGFMPNDIARFLISKGVDGKSQVFVCENLTLDDEKLLQISLKEASLKRFSSLCIMVVKPIWPKKGKEYVDL